MMPQQDCYRYYQYGRQCHALYSGRNAETIRLTVDFDAIVFFIDVAIAFMEDEEKRIAKLDHILKLYNVGNISGTFSPKRFLKLSVDYEAKQKELIEQVKAWRETVETFDQNQADFDSFAAIVRKYVGIRKLTANIVNEFLKKIIIYAADKSSGHRKQKMEPLRNFIEEINLPGNDQTVER